MNPITRHVEIRSEDGGAVSGTVVSYGDTAHIGRTFYERFMPGSIHYDDVVLNLLHDRQKPVSRLGAGLELLDDASKFAMRSALPDTVFGREARELIDAGIIKGLSAEFVPQVESFDGAARVIKRAELVGIALVDRPAYPASTLDKRSAWFSGHLRLRAGAISGFIPYAVAGLVSMQKRRKMIIEKGSLSLADSVYLLAGFDYNASLAATAARSMRLRLTERGIEFATRRLPATSELRDVRKRIRAGLINGVVPGIAVEDSDMYDEGGFSVERVKKGMLCEINLTAREGLATSFRSKKWLF